MSQDRCPHCDQPLVAPASQSDLADIEHATRHSASPFVSGNESSVEMYSIPLSPAERELPTSNNDHGQRWSPATKLLAGVGGVVAVAALVVASLVVASPDPSLNPADDPAPEKENPAEIVSADVPESSANGQTGTTADEATDTATTLFENLEVTDRQYAIVYPSADGLEVLGASGQQTVQPVAVERFDDVLGFPLLVDGTRTWAIDAEAPEQTFIAAYNHVLASTHVQGSYVFLVERSNGEYSAGITVHGVSGPLFELPAGAEVLAVQGVGLLYLPVTGGTYRIADSLQPELFSEGRVLAAAASGFLEESCTDGLTCPLTMHFNDGRPTVELPLPRTGTFAISPDGNWVTRVTAAGEIELTSVADQSVATIGDNATEVIWAPDSTFFAWLNGDRLTVHSPLGDSVEQLLPSRPMSTRLLITDRGA